MTGVLRTDDGVRRLVGKYAPPNGPLLSFQEWGAILVVGGATAVITFTTARPLGGVVAAITAATLAVVTAWAAQRIMVKLIDPDTPFHYWVASLIATISSPRPNPPKAETTISLRLDKETIRNTWRRERIKFPRGKAEGHN